MTQSTQSLVTAADHADALIVARRVKTTLCMLLFFVLGSALTLFFLMRYWPALQPATAMTSAPSSPQTQAVTRYVIGLLDFAGLILPPLLAAFVLVLLLVQVVARVAGAGRSTSALAWAVLLMLLLFPWQAVLNNPAITNDPVADAIGMKVPGVIFTWAEASNPTLGARFAEVNAPPTPVEAGGVPDPKVMAVLHWLRFAGFPLLAMVIVGVIHTKTERGLRQSFVSDEAVLPPTVDDGSTVVVTDGPQL